VDVFTQPCGARSGSPQLVWTTYLGECAAVLVLQCCMATTSTMQLRNYCMHSKIWPQRRGAIFDYVMIKAGCLDTR